MSASDDDNRQRQNRGRFNRRVLLQRCGLSAFAWNVCGLLATQAAERSAPRLQTRNPIRSCIFVFYYGGPSHLDTFDMKPDAPAEIRGEFQPIATTAPGVQICEHLPHLAKVMHKFAVVRTMHHENRLHDSASTETFTGRQGPQGDREEFSPIPQFFPSHGAVLHHLRQQLACDVHHAVLPWMFHNVIDVPCQGGGFLGSAFDPFPVGGDPATVSFRAEMLKCPDSLSVQRIAHRRALLGRLDDELVSARKPARQLASLYERAYELLGSKRLHEALQIEAENDGTRERYGYGEKWERGGTNGAEHAYGRNLRGQSLLLARRLVEAGVPFVNVNDFRQQGQNWDAHADNFGQHRDHLLPPADRSLSALIEDLDARGLLDSTLVVALGEFGRTPKINAQAGRDHWPDCYSILLAGGGIQGGQVYGASDRHGTYPDRDAVTPADLAATIYWRFGLDPTTHIQDHTGRPYRLSDGQPLSALFG